LIDQPAGLFSGAMLTNLRGLPIYTLAKGLTFSFFDLFNLVSLLKAIQQKQQVKYVFKKPLLLLGGYMIFLILFSLVIGMSFKMISGLFRNIIQISLLFSIPVLLSKKEDVFVLAHLVFPIVFLVFFGQIYYVLYGKELASYFDHDIEVTAGLLVGEIRPEIRGVFLTFFSLIFALFYIVQKEYLKSKFYLYIIISVATISVIASQTRGWIGMFLSILVIYFTIIEKFKMKTLMYLFMMFTIIIIAYNTYPHFHSIVDLGIIRFSTVELLVAGDATAGGTLARITERLPRVLEGFYQNPVIGWGFSSVYNEYADGHVGNFNLLLQVGLFGFCFWLYFWIFYFRKIFYFKSKFSKQNDYAKSLNVLLLAQIGMLILHFTSLQFFGYSIYFCGLFFLFLFYSLSNTIILGKINHLPG
jgi:hypothetical protein